MKNPFKKSSITDTLMNVGLGGVANVGFDYLYKLTGLDLGETTKNAIKIAVGAVGGSMVSSKPLRAAADGIAVVGVSNLISGLIDGDDETGGSNAGSGDETATTAGVAFMGRLGQKGFRREYGKKVGKVPFMS